MPGHAMFRYAGKRLLQAIPVLFGVTFITFSMLNLLPGNAAMLILGADATPASLKALEHRLGLDQPFFERFGHWIGHFLTGNLGTSLMNGEPVSSIIGQRLPVTLELVLLAFAISLLVALPVSLLAARRPRKIADRVSMAISMVGLSVPEFVTGLILILIFAVKLHLVPATGYQPLSAGLWANLRYMILPSATLAFGLFAGYSRVLRGDILDQLVGEDYIVTARAKGIGQMRVLLKHALRNSVFPLITLVGLNFGRLIGGTVLIETIFALPGMGQELVSAINSRDVTTVQGIVVLLAVAVTLSNLLTDIVYGVLDPRIRIQGRT